MREIKFRAWDSFNKKMLSWEQFKNIKFDVGDGYDVGIPLEILDEKYQKQHNLIPQQFTGLYDKNGKEIYEGDICNHEYHPNYSGIIRWEEELLSYAFTLKDKDGEYEQYFFIKSDGKKYKVIGNIYENPELLTK